MAATMASTFALSRPSEKLGTHSTRVYIREKNIRQGHKPATFSDASRALFLKIRLMVRSRNYRRVPLCTFVSLVVKALAFLVPKKLPHPNPHLYGVNPRIVVAQSGIRN